MFRFKQFTVHQDRCAMKVGTDGTLLAAWADLHRCRRLLDIGTGTGLIALICAQRTPQHTSIDAIEIDPMAAEQAAENVAASPFASKITVHATSLQHFTPAAAYDRILCNPPYFTSSLKCPDSRRTAARHNDTLPPGDLSAYVSRMLSPDGLFCLILPLRESEEFIRIAASDNLYLTEQIHVHPTPASGAKRILLSFSHHAPSSSPIGGILAIEHAPGKYTDEYIALTRDFYLKM